MRRAAALIAVLPLAACAHGGGGSAPEPQAVAQPPNARSKLYADCVGQAAQAATYDRYGRYMRLTCTGAPAEALFTAMEPYARARGNDSVVDGVETRGMTSTTVNDRCRRDASGTSCLIIMPVGGFLDPANDVPPPKEKAK